jgi:excisionase family DNA binding protein
VVAVDNEHQQDHLMHPHEVAALAGVDAKTITRWARDGKLPHIKTLGGHRRYRESVVRETLGLPKDEVES